MKEAKKRRMKKLLVYFKPEDIEKLRKHARSLDESMAHVVRRAVRREFQIAVNR